MCNHFFTKIFQKSIIHFWPYIRKSQWRICSSFKPRPGTWGHMLVSTAQGTTSPLAAYIPMVQRQWKGTRITLRKLRAVQGCVPLPTQSCLFYCMQNTDSCPLRCFIFLTTSALSCFPSSTSPFSHSVPVVS